MRKAALGFGSNLGDRTAMIEAAIAALQDRADIEVISVAPAYSTPPWGLEDQPDFITSCVSARVWNRRSGERLACAGGRG